MPAEPAAVPAMPVWQADERWQRIDLLSDVHLHADMPLTFEAWRHHLLSTPADAVLLLGDLFEVWVGDDARHSGFEARCVAVLQEAAQRRVLAFLPGNRDFLVGDALLAEVPMRRLADPTVLLAFGRRWLLSHGDALCLADTDYQRFRAMVRQPAWQRQFLDQPLAVREQQARAIRDASAAHQATMAPDQWSDVDNVAAGAWLAAADAHVLVHGHTHRPAVHALGDGRSRQVLGDWDLDATPPRARALMLDATGLQVLDLAAG